MTHLTHRLAGAALLAVFAVSAQAEPVTTRIGELSFDVGYPTAETAERLYDEMDFQRATQAYIWALPAVGFRALHLAHLNAFDAPNGVAFAGDEAPDISSVVYVAHAAQHRRLFAMQLRHRSVSSLHNNTLQIPCCFGARFDHSPQPRAAGQSCLPAPS